MMPDVRVPAALDRGSASRRWGDLLPRVLSGLVMVGVALGVTIAGGPLFASFWLLAAIALVWEWQRLVGAEALWPRFAVGAAALCGAALAATFGHWWPSVALVSLGAVAAALAGPGRRTMAGCGILYAGAPLLSVLLLRQSSLDGRMALFWLFAVVWGTDIMAYFGGRLVGGPKLWPRLSPSKTWAGFLIGITSGALAGLLVAPAASSSVPVLMIGIAAGALAQGGDLLESSIKRYYGVKDTSNLIPGHGGVMDRLDGFIVAATFAACVGVAHAGLDAAGRGVFNWP